MIRKTELLSKIILVFSFLLGGAAKGEFFKHISIGPLFSVAKVTNLPFNSIYSPPKATPTIQPTINIINNLPHKIIPYDQKRWKKIDTKTMGFLNQPRITGINIRSNKVMWVGSSGGYANFNGKFWKTFLTDDGFDSMLMFLDNKENFWTIKKENSDFHLCKYDGEKWVLYESPFTSPSSIIEDKKGVFWLSDNKNPQGNIARFDGKSWEYYLVFNKWGQFADIKGIEFDSKDRLWVGSQNGLYYFDRNEWHLIPNYQLRGRESEIGVTNFTISHDGSIWMIFDQNTLLKYNHGTSTIYQNPYLSQLDFTSGIRILLDKSSSMWIAGWDRNSKNSVMRLTNKGWEIFEQPEIGYISGLSLSQDGSIWIGSIDAIYKYNP